MSYPYEIVREFERELCAYTGAPYCVTTTSCTMALLLACAWQARRQRRPYGPEYPLGLVRIPKHTYVGVPMSVIHAGFGVSFDDTEWEGEYQLHPLPVFDSARWFYAGMWEEADRDIMVCLSFHPTKTLGLSTHGGAILHDDPEADEWLRMARFDGRREGVEPKDQKDWILGYHCYMNPVTAAEGLTRLATLPKHNEPLPNDDYPDLSKLEIFK